MAVRGRERILLKKKKRREEKEKKNEALFALFRVAASARTAHIHPSIHPSTNQDPKFTLYVWLQTTARQERQTERRQPEWTQKSRDKRQETKKKNAGRKDCPTKHSNPFTSKP